jgi:hypothetical protein
MPPSHPEASPGPFQRTAHPAKLAVKHFGQTKCVAQHSLLAPLPHHAAQPVLPLRPAPPSAT